MIHRQSNENSLLPVHAIEAWLSEFFSSKITSLTQVVWVQIEASDLMSPNQLHSLWSSQEAQTPTQARIN